MSNQQTAAEWKQAAARAAAELESVSAKIYDAEGRISQIEARQREIMQQRNALSREGVGMNDPRAAALRSEYFKLDDQAVQQSAFKGQLLERETLLQITVDRATEQAAQASTGAPNTSTNTPPATDRPNTDPTTIPPANAVPPPDISTPASTIPPTDAVIDTAEYRNAVANAEVAAYGVETAPAQPPTAEQIAAEDLAVYPNQAVSVEERERITQEEIAASDLEVYPRDVPSEEDLAMFDQENAIRAAQAEQAAESYGGASEAEYNAITQAQANNARAQQTIAGQRRAVNNGDWRVRLSLAPRADYLYRANNAGILAPLAQTDGVIFPYTPTISTGYRANYGQSDLTHSNYRGYFYQNSYVEAVNLKCPFTAQSTAEADYLLAVIHFFRSVTKMFYGQDPQRGAPPPLVYLTGLGQYQFAEHACVVTSFDYNLPGDVDYIRAGSGNMNQTNIQNLRPRGTGAASSVNSWGALLGGALDRLTNAGATKGAVTPSAPSPQFDRNNPTYVPTKMEISITLLPMQSRAQVSQQFSVKGFANGDLLKGGFW